MVRRLAIIAIAIVLSVALLAPSLLVAPARATPEQKRPELTREWSLGIVADGVGPAGIHVSDLDLDGKNEIVACGAGAAYVLRWVTDSYTTAWYDESNHCVKVAVGDRDGDGKREIYVARGTQQYSPVAFSPRVDVFDGVTYAKIASVSLPGAETVDGLMVTNVDTDPGAELVVVRSNATLIYNASTLALEWEATGKGGNGVGAGDVDGDGQIEVVVNGNPAHVLNASTQSEEFAWSGGFGFAMSVADVDGDGRAEAAYLSAAWTANLVVLNLDTRVVEWQVGPFSNVGAIATGDVNQDGRADVLVGEAQWGSVLVYDGPTGTAIGSVTNPEHGVFGISSGDADGDGAVEVIFGAGLSSTGKDVLCVGNWQTKAVEWLSPDLDGPLFAAAGDIDADGQAELVLLSAASNSGYSGSSLMVYNGATHAKEWEISPDFGSGAGTSGNALVLGQLDADPALEILGAIPSYSGARLRAYDGSTHTMQWESGDLGGALTALALGNVDADARQEIIVGTANGLVQVFDEASNLLYWTSSPLDGAVRDLAVGDIDGDGTVELVVLTENRLYKFTVAGWSQESSAIIAGGVNLAILGGPGAAQLLVATTNSTGTTAIKALAGTDLSPAWERNAGEFTARDLLTADLDGDGTAEYVLLGGPTEAYNYDPSPGVLTVGSQTVRTFWEYRSVTAPPGPKGLFFADVDGDGTPELGVAAQSSVAIYGVTATALTSGQVFLPLVNKNYRPFLSTVVSEDFEGTFPGSWEVLDLSNYDGGDYRWGKSNCRPRAGTYSGWVLGGSGMQSCGSWYPNYAYTWMIYGPFSLVGATAGWIEADIWHDFADSNDRVSFFVSVDGDSFYGYRTQPGSSGGWQHVEIPLADYDIPNVGGVLGQPNVWVGFRFYSDSSGTAAEGAYLDNILVTKQVPPAGVASLGAAPSPKSGIRLIRDSELLVAPGR